MGIHKYGLDTSPSQLGIKILGTRIPGAHWARILIMPSLCILMKLLRAIYFMMCVTYCVNYIHSRMYIGKC